MQWYYSNAANHRSFTIEVYLSWMDALLEWNMQSFYKYVVHVCPGDY
jgi:hypothetical protein